MTQEQPQCAANCLISLWPRSSFLSTFFQVFGRDLFSLSALFKDLLYAGSPFSRCAAISSLSPSFSCCPLYLILSAHTATCFLAFSLSFTPPPPSKPSVHLSHSAPLYSNFLLQSQLAIEDTMTHVLHPRHVCVCV